MVKYLKNTENSLLRAVIERMVEEGSGGYIKQVEKYMQTVGTSYILYRTDKNKERKN